MTWVIPISSQGNLKVKEEIRRERGRERERERERESERESASTIREGLGFIVIFKMEKMQTPRKDGGVGRSWCQSAP